MNFTSAAALSHYKIVIATCNNNNDHDMYVPHFPTVVHWYNILGIDNCESRYNEMLRIGNPLTMSMWKNTIRTEMPMNENSIEALGSGSEYW